MTFVKGLCKAMEEMDEMFIFFYYHTKKSTTLNSINGH